MTTIFLKSAEATERFSALIEQAKKDGIITEDDSVGCHVSTDFAVWTKEVNEDKSSPMRHLAPTTETQMRNMFASSLPENVVELDCSFERCSEAAIQFVMKSALTFLDDIDRVTDGRTMAERSGFTDDELREYIYLEEKNDMLFKPSKNMKRTPREDMPTSGVLSAKGKNGEGVVHFLFGNTECMDWYLDDEYLDKSDNAPYQNDKGEKFILLPLMPFGPEAATITNHIYCNLKQYSSISFYHLMNIIYPNALNIPYSIEFLTKELPTTMSTDDALGMLNDAIHNFKQLYYYDISGIKIERCKRNGKVEVSFPSHISGSWQFQNAIEMALSYIKHNKVGFYKKVVTNMSLHDIVSESK